MHGLPHTAQALIGKVVRVRSLGSTNRYRVLVDNVTEMEHGWILVHGQIQDRQPKPRRFLTSVGPDYEIEIVE